MGAVGLVAGVVLGAMGMMSLRGGDGPYASSPASTRSMGAASAPAPASTFVTAVSVNCELAPMLSKGGEGDGQVALQSRPAAATGSEVGSLILSGKEAAAAGRQRDAEVSFLNACRNAAVLPEGDGIPLSDAMYQLGRHYATVAAFGAPKGARNCCSAPSGSTARAWKATARAWGPPTRRRSSRRRGWSPCARAPAGP
ncbi:hypothetical protein [Ramlibacter montanisoli]|uniref:Uncharacterized protein n=1 Tax=Ramlibacter montanisoli TaxID=2732512 RepID=A0A849KER6_9BURK|nr:hypothetical protein [Ramlibacter montanisoli]NNU43966.1 hypothetical protein [Ramlibacter montanisoli]